MLHVAGRLEWIGDRAHDFLAGAQTGQVLHVLGSVLPVTVDGDAINNPSASSILYDGGHAADGMEVFHHVFATGPEVASSGVLLLTACKSSMVSGMSNERAIAIRCSTALVEPPRTAR